MCLYVCGPIMMKKNIICEKFLFLLLSFLITVYIAITAVHCRHKKQKFQYTRSAVDTNTRTICLNMNNTLRARHKTCFLRPDTGPCRSDIIQWYFDVKQNRCFRFFWGGCQGNGNRFETRQECHNYCYMNSERAQLRIPYFCSLAFDYGTCFGYFHRWTWDRLDKTCKRRLYSGCGGNQNNFQSLEECIKTCIMAPNNTMIRSYERKLTTCVPIHVEDYEK